MFWLTLLLPKSPLLLWGENASLCQKDQEQNLGLVLTSLKNVYQSLNRWGLENNIKVSAALDSECLRDDLGEKIIKPLLELSGVLPTPSIFLHVSLLFGGKLEFQDFIKKFGSVEPARPSPLAEISPSSIHSSVEFSVSANAGRTPHPPPPLSLPVSSPPPLPLSHCTKAASAVTTAPALEMEMMQKLWCVTKPSVPAETPQEAMDHACGECGADCQEIMPNGSCFDPDTVVAHVPMLPIAIGRKPREMKELAVLGAML
ncbi:hypothetical protein SLEP1_g8309 [Rubroshorea leprosula]|uniref:X8 domain-containing protein n=1 Tax=Rubroshorea leprosula TaxID=152421 RepID=A0AAV5I156_9ROSI|nr:hypothetical protein SLEP1_g8309 [Rubroshorea leprosula]